MECTDSPYVWCYVPTEKRITFHRPHFANPGAKRNGASFTAWAKRKCCQNCGEKLIFADATEKQCKNLVEKLIVFPEKQKHCKNWVEKLTVSKGHSGEIF